MRNFEMIKVSVCCITYNHEHYIAAAIESVLAQKFDGIIEMIIGEDCSSDATRTLAMTYQERFPKQINVLTPSINLGMTLNLMTTLNKCDGDYICILDGDDYWTDDTKVQKQVAFLETHREYAICSHNLVNVRSQSNLSTDLVRTEREEHDYTIEDLAKENFVATASCMYRNNFTAGDAPTGYPNWLLDVKIGDYCLSMLAARHGKIKYFPDVMGAYRIHDGGVWTKESHVGRAIMFFSTFHHLRKEFSGEVREKLLRQQEANFQILSDADDATLNAFLQQNKEEVLDFLSEDYSRMLELYFHNFNAVRSAEYRLGKTLVNPIRKLIDWYRSSN